MGRDDLGLKAYSELLNLQSGRNKSTQSECPKRKKEPPAKNIDKQWIKEAKNLRHYEKLKHPEDFSKGYFFDELAELILADDAMKSL